MPASRLSITALPLALALLASGCAAPPDPAPELRLGIILPVGPHAGYQTDAMLAGAELAIAEAGDSAGGGFTFSVRLLTADSSGSAEAAVDGIRRLVIRDRAAALIGPYLSRSVLRASPLVEQLEVPLLTPTATHPEVGAGRRYVFRVARAGAEFQGDALAELALRDLGAERAAALFEQTDLYSRRVTEAFGRRFAELGGEPVAVEGYATGVASYREPLLRLRQRGPEVLLLPNNSQAELAAQTAAAREMGLTAVLLGGDTWAEIDAAAPALTAAYFANHWHPEVDSPESRSFVAAYERRFGASPTVAAALTYDAVAALLAAVRHVGSIDSRQIRAGLVALGEHRGVTGVLGFGPGERPRGLYIIRIHDGETSLYCRFGEDGLYR